MKQTFTNTDSLERVWPTLVNPETGTTLGLKPGEKADLDPEAQVRAAAEAQLPKDLEPEKRESAIKAILGVAEDVDFVFDDPFLKPVPQPSSKKVSNEKASGKGSDKPADA